MDVMQLTNKGKRNKSYLKDQDIKEIIDLWDGKGNRKGEYKNLRLGVHAISKKTGHTPMTVRKYLKRKGRL